MQQSLGTDRPLAYLLVPILMRSQWILAVVQMDRLQPFLHNTLTGGHTWVESGTARPSVEKRMAIIKDFMPEVYKWVEQNLENAIAKGWLKA